MPALGIGAAVLLAGRTFHFYVRNDTNTDDVEIQMEHEILSLKKIETKNGVSDVVMRAVRPGQTKIIFTVYPNPQDHHVHASYLHNVQIPSFLVIFEDGWNYGGHQIVRAGFAFFLLAAAVFLLIQHRYRRRTQMFTYKTVLDLGLALFFGVLGAVFSALFVLCAVTPLNASATMVYNFSGLVMTLLVAASLPLILLLAGFLSLSNLALIRHEGFRFRNLLGLMISAAMLLGAAGCILLLYWFPVLDLSLESAGISGVRSAVSAAFLYFECILFATVYCCFAAVRTKPPYNQDYIIILGCAIRPDGSLPPLLRGRVDHALAFAREQLAAAGKPVRFIPSGGQGGNECMPEAAAMQRYLLEQGVAQAEILPEEKSATTLENMRFSHELIQKEKPDANILFSTTNYHVFRAGMLSAKAGLRAGGIGAKTKWYFWPNAEIREFFGLLAVEYRVHLAILALLAAFSALLANAPAVVAHILSV